jgi:drug/metabolite transporter (DMT)-like permease
MSDSVEPQHGTMIEENGPQGAATPHHVNPVGYLYLIVSVVLNGTAFHFIRVSLQYVPPATAVTVFCASAVVGILVAGMLCRTLGLDPAGISSVTPGAVVRRLLAQWRILLPVTAIGLLGGWLIATTVGLYGPELTAFLSNLAILFLILGGTVRGDRLALREWIYAFAVVVGVFLFSWRGQELAWLAIGLIALGSFLTATKQIVIKEAVPHGGLWTLMAAQQFLFAMWGLVLATATGELVVPPLASMPWMIMAGLFQNFLGMSLLYAGYGKVGVARGAPIYALRPLIVLVIGIAIGTAHPGAPQYVGGALVLLGSALLAGHRPRR